MPRRSSDEFDSRDLQPLVNAFFGLNRRMQIVVIVIVVLGVIGYGVWYVHNQHQLVQNRQQVADASPNLLLGNPSQATADSSNRDNYLMAKPFYVLSYNDSKGTPNWVSWQVTTSDLGEAPRKMDFDSDLELPDGFYRVTHKDYSGSGFDRGHMCPHSDRAATQEMSYATFVMSNIIPQAPNVNRKAWAQLEVYCRELVRGGDRLYILAGPIGKGGNGSKGPREVLADGRVTVPAECWKVIVVVPGWSGNDLASISLGTRVIAVIMPNDEDQVGEEWAIFRTSPAKIEGKTGLQFFTKLRRDIASALRMKVDSESIARPRPLVHSAD